MTDIPTVIAEVNRTPAIWRGLTVDVKLSIACHYLAEIARDSDTLTVAEFRDATPGWFPRDISNFLRRTINTHWTDFISDFGLRQPYGYELKARRDAMVKPEAAMCECGRGRATVVVSLVLGNPSGDFPYHPRVRWCAQCAADDKAMRAELRERGKELA